MSFLSKILAFFGPVAGSVRGFLTPAELARATQAAAGASTLVGFAVAFLTQIGTDARSQAAGSVGAALVAFAAVQTAELLRRLGQRAPAKVVPPTPPPAAK